MPSDHLTSLDRLIDCADNALRTLFASPVPTRESPASRTPETQLDQAQQRLSASLMRVNHTGEVCAQALYQGQSLTAKLPQVRAEMEQAANEEIDHLAWCAERLNQLDRRPSIFNPLFYAASFAIGAAAGAVSDRISLGFVAATEDQVCAHLQSHIGSLPADDKKSRAILDQMHLDEMRHQKAALDAGGMVFPAPVKRAMTMVSRVMTLTSSRI